MTNEKANEREDLRALMKSPQVGLPGYSADPIVQRRVGRVVAETSTRLHSRHMPPLTAYIAAMYDRFTQHYTWKEIYDLYELTAPKPPSNMRLRYNICPTTTIDTVMSRDGKREKRLKWPRAAL